jgi:hypothetical protein
MSHTSTLERLGFAREDLGVKLDCARCFFFFEGVTHAFDEEGRSWIKAGKLDLGEWLFQHIEPVLFAMPVDHPELWETEEV